MAKLSLKVKAKRAPKFKTRRYNRCELCGRVHAYYRKFKVCRCCFRQLALMGRIPGVRKASW